LTEQGRAVFPIVIGLRQWGERYLFTEGEPRSQLVDERGQGQTLQVRAEDGRVVEPERCQRQLVRHG
jgi:hypothetical protein